MNGRHLAFPFRISGDGRTATPATLDAHVKDEVIQLLLTNPGERPLIPSFGAGLRRLVFEANDNITASVAKARLTQAVGRWLGERIELMVIEVNNNESTLSVTLQYRVKHSGEVQILQFEHRP